MGIIYREPATAAKENYDLIIIGGGIYGVMLSLEASRRKLCSLLIERGDFGGATSFNHQRTIHGGLRYLQTFDLQRFRESVWERRWFMQTFPELVKPLPVIMPLYGNGLRRPSIFRVALLANDLLSCNRNRSVRSDLHLPRGRVINAGQTREIFPAADPKGLKGGAVWYDALMPDSQCLLIEILRWSCKYGATALNYIEARELLQSKEGVAGVKAIDIISGDTHEYRANVVVNAAGPWCRELAHIFGQDEPQLFRSSLAWHLLLNREALSDHAVAVTPKIPGGQTYFLLPWKGKLLAGTGHAPWCDSPDKPTPTYQHLQKFIKNLNLAVPNLDLTIEDVSRIFAGLLPVKSDGSVDLTVREVIFNHSNHGGPQGLYSVSGIKFTTSRCVAEKTLNLIFPEKKVINNFGEENFQPRQITRERRGIFDYDWHPSDNSHSWKKTLQTVINEESVQQLDDLILRRTSLWENSYRAVEIAPLICDLFAWDDSRRNQECERLKQILQQTASDL